MSHSSNNPTTSSRGFVLKTSLLSLFCVVFLLASLTSAAPLGYKLEYLGLPAVPDGFCPYFVTKSGLVAGQYSKGNGNSQAFIWKDGVSYDLKPPDGYTHISVVDTNNQGLVLASVQKKIGEPEACLCELTKDGTVTYKVITCPGKTRCSGRCIGDDGQVAGTTDGYLTAFVWKDGTTKLLQSPIGVSETEAWAANDVGDVAGTARTSSDKTLRGSAVLWSASGVKVLDKPEGCDWVRPMFLNNKGAMLLRGDKSDSSVSRWFYWVTAGVQEIVLPEERTYSAITGLNERGEVIGEFRAGGKTYAFVWQDGKLHYLSTLRQTLGNMERSCAINNRGEIVGHSGGLDCGFQAVVWEEGRIMVLESPDHKQHLNSVAHYINDDGVILGKVEVEPGNWQIVLWRPAS